MRSIHIFALVATFFLGCTSKQQYSDPHQSLRIFSELFSQFRKDAQATRASTDYPNELKDFVKSGYISSADFTKLTQGLKIFYINPKKSNKSDVILAVFLDRGNQLSVFGQLRRDLSYDTYMETRTFLKAEQDAAANP